MNEEEIKEKYNQCKKYLRRGKCSEVCLLLQENPQVKKYLTNKELIKIIDFYERVTMSMAADKVERVRDSLKSYHVKLEKIVKDIKENLQGFKEDLGKII